MKTLAVVKHVTQYWVFLDIKLFYSTLEERLLFIFTVEQIWCQIYNCNSFNPVTIVNLEWKTREANSSSSVVGAIS